MTTSPSPSPVPPINTTVNGSTPISTNPSTSTTTETVTGTASVASSGSGAGAALTEERTTTIGWFFIQSYYDFFVNKLDTIHKIYHTKAILSHDAYPVQDKQSPATTHTAKGIDAIKSRFSIEEEHASANRIVITSATFQTSLDKNIIIVVFGEWAKGDDSFRQFTQTFVLTPGKKENTFDVANDILKFIVVNGFTELNEVETESVQPEEEPKPVVVVAEELKQEVVEEEVPEVDTAETTVESEIVVEEKQEVNGTSEVETKPEPEDEKEKEKEKEEEQQSEQPEEIAAPVETTEPTGPTEPETPIETTTPAVSTPSKPLSWADLASQSTAKQLSKATSPTATTKPPTSTTTTTSITTAVTLKKQSSSPTGSSPVTTTNTGKFKKEDWFPIYIRGIKQLDEKSLKDHLSSEFGELKFFKVIQNIALCDFVAQDAQRKALDTKETTLDGVTFQLEPRESKTGNNYHNGKFSQKFNKDGNQDKRKFDNKKVNGVKKRT